MICCCALLPLWRNLKSIGTPLCKFFPAEKAGHEWAGAKLVKCSWGIPLAYFLSWDPRINFSPCSGPDKIYWWKSASFPQAFGKTNGEDLLSYMCYHIFPRNSYFTLQQLRRIQPDCWVHCTQLQVCCTLLCSFQSRALVLAVLVQKNGTPNLLLVLLYTTAFCIMTMFWCSHWRYCRWEWILIIYPFKGTCSQTEGGLGSRDWFPPSCTVDEQAVCTKCRLTPCRQVSHSRMQTSIWKAVSVGYPHRCRNDCCSNIIHHCAKAFFNLCFQMVLSCCHMSST